MRFDWLARVRTHLHRSCRSCSRTWRIESLESRVLLTAFTVDSIADSNDLVPGDGIAADLQGRVTLRAAIQEANALAGPDTIILPAGTFYLALSGPEENLAASDDMDVCDELTITGAGRDQTIQRKFQRR